MTQDQREFTKSPIPPAITTDGMNRTSRTVRYERQSTAVESINRPRTEEDRRLLLKKDMSDAHEKGFWICRLWQLLLTLNLTIILTTISLVCLLLFIIGPLSLYQTYGQSCRALSCNSGQGLVCNTASICACPSTNSYWSHNETGCRRCPIGWSIVDGKCLFVSTFTSNWTDALTYCESFTAQLLTLSTFTLSYVSNIVAPNTNYFIGLSEQPSDSGHWQWVDGSSMLSSSSSSSSSNLFCTNGSINRFDPIFRTNMHCGIYRMDSCLARCACQRIDINFLCEKI